MGCALSVEMGCSALPFRGRFGGVDSETSRGGFSSPARLYSDAKVFIAANTDPLLEGPPGDSLYRHAETGLVCAADARIDSAPNLADADTGLRGPAAIFAYAYLTFGIDFLSRILGDFAGVIWDPRRQRLLLFVDRMPPRGVYYANSGAATLFSTDIRTFSSASSGRVDVDSLIAWASDPTRRTVWTGGGTCERVPSGHVAVFERKTVTLHRYWDPASAPDVRFRKSEDYVDAAEALLEEAVRCRLPRRLKLGCHLSGGLDAPLITGTAAKLLAKSGRTLTAFTYTHTDPDIPAIWDGRYWDEHRAAAEFAARFANIEHVQISTDAPGLFDGQQSILSAAGGVTLSALPVWASRHAVAAKAQSYGIGAMLTGMIGNETFSQDGASVLSYLLRRGQWGKLLHDGTALWRNGTPIKKLLGRTFVPVLPTTMQNRIVDWLGIPLPPSLADFIPLATTLRATLEHADRPETPENQQRWPTPRQIIGRLYGGGSIHTWYRQGFGFDLRVPFSDSRILEFCAGLPPDQYCGDGEDRHLARRLLRRLGAPDELVNETRRGIQYANWHSTMMRERPALYREIDILEANATACRLLDLAQMRRLVDELPSATPTSRSDLMKVGNRLSAGLSIGRYVLYLEGSNAGPPLTDIGGDDWQTSPGSSIYN